MIATAVLAVSTIAAGVMRPVPIASGFELNIAPPEGAEFQIGANLGGVVVSPDGSTVAFIAATQQGAPALWIRSLATDDARALPKTEGAYIASGLPDVTGTTRQVTTHPDYDESASWSPDGKRMAHVGRDEGKPVIVLTALDGVTPPALIRRDTQSSVVWTPDGRFLLFSMIGSGTGLNPWALLLEKPDDAVELNTDPESEVPLSISPSGRWLAMASLSRGVPRSYLTRFIVDNGRPRLGSQRIPLEGLLAPAWTRDGREILGLTGDRRIVSISVSDSGDALTLGKPVELFALSSSSTGDWAASPDGSRFVIADAPRAVRQSLRVLTNWEERLNR